MTADTRIEDLADVFLRMATREERAFGRLTIIATPRDYVLRFPLEGRIGPNAAHDIHFGSAIDLATLLVHAADAIDAVRDTTRGGALLAAAVS